MLLLVVLCTVVVEPILFDHRAASWIFDIVYSLTLLSAVLAFSTRRRTRVWLGSLGMITLSTTWIYHLVPDSLTFAAMVAHHLVGIGFLFLVVGVTLKSLFTAGEANFDTVMGTLAGYLLLGIAWGLIYSLIHLTSPETSFLFGDQLPMFVEQTNARLSVFVYYSFVTLTTVGFGDISPISQTARTLSWLEAAVGQFYIATLVAGIVGILVNRRRGENQG
jgi:hypothetical protein